jgi:hypothetical protein
MRPITQTSKLDARRRFPKSFRLLTTAIALADECAREMVANLDAPDLAATGDRIERVQEERRELASAMEDHLHGALLSPLDPADLHGLSAHIGLFTHRVARALYFFSLLGAAPAPSDLRVLARLLGDASAELVEVIDSLVEGRTRTIAERVHVVRRLRDQARLQTGKILALAPSSEDRDVVLWRTVGEAIDAAAAQALTVAEEALRVATKHD